MVFVQPISKRFREHLITPKSCMKLKKGYNDGVNRLTNGKRRKDL